MKRYIYVALGLITLSLGLLGIVTPGLPTTPFVLLTAFLFAKGSPRLHQKLLNHKLTGRYLNRVNEGLGAKGLIISISFMWFMIFFTAFAVFDYGTMRFVMLGLGVIGTISQIIVLRRKKKAVIVPLKTEENFETKDRKFKVS